MASFGSLTANSMEVVSESEAEAEAESEADKSSNSNVDDQVEKAEDSQGSRAVTTGNDDENEVSSSNDEDESPEAEMLDDAGEQIMSQLAENRDRASNPMRLEPTTYLAPSVLGANQLQPLADLQANFICDDPNCSFWQRAKQLANELMCSQLAQAGNTLNPQKYVGQPIPTDCCANTGPSQSSTCPYLADTLSLFKAAQPSTPSPPPQHSAASLSFLLANRPVSPMNQPLHLVTPRISFARRNSSAANFAVPQRSQSSAFKQPLNPTMLPMHSNSSVALDGSSQLDENSSCTLRGSMKQAGSSTSQSRKSSVTFAPVEASNRQETEELEATRSQSKCKPLKLAIELARNVKPDASGVAISVTDLSSVDLGTLLVDELDNKSRRRSSQDDRSISGSVESRSSGGSLVSIEPDGEQFNEMPSEKRDSRDSANGISQLGASNNFGPLARLGSGANAPPRTPSPPSASSYPESRPEGFNFARAKRSSSGSGSSSNQASNRQTFIDGAPHRSPSMHSPLASGSRSPVQRYGVSSSPTSDQDEGRPKRHHSVNERPQQLYVLSPPNSTFRHSHHHHHQSSGSLAQSPTGSLSSQLNARNRMPSSGSHSPSPRFNFGR